METLEQLRLNLSEDTESKPERSPLSARESRVSRTALREKVWAILTSVTSNKSICELSENLNRDGRSLKIRQVYSQGKISDTSIEYWTTFPRWGILSHGECGELLTSEPRTSERVFIIAHSDSERRDCLCKDFKERRSGMYLQATSSEEPWEKVRTYEEIDGVFGILGDTPEPYMRFERDDNGISTGMDRLRGIGNAVVPYQAYPIFEMIAKLEEERQ